MSAPLSHLLETMVHISGVATYSGTFPAFRIKKTGRVVEALCLFTSLSTGTSLALPVSKVSASAIRAHTLASDSLFEVFKTKVASNILKQFCREVE